MLDGVEDLIPPWDSLALYLILVLRLAVLLHRDRSGAPLPAIELTPRPRTLELHFKLRSLRDHPLTSADLQQEVEYLKDQGLRLRIFTS